MRLAAVVSRARRRVRPRSRRAAVVLVCASLLAAGLGAVAAPAGATSVAAAPGHQPSAVTTALSRASDRSTSASTFHAVGTALAYTSRKGEGPIAPRKARTVALAALPAEAHSALVIITVRGVDGRGDLLVRRSPTGGAFARVRASSTHATSTILLVPVSQGRVFLKAEKGSRVHVRIDLLGYDLGTVPPKAKGRSAVALVQGRSSAGSPTTVAIARNHGAPRAKKLLAALVRVTTRKAAASGGVQLYAAGGDAGAAVAPIVSGRRTSTIVLVPTGSTGQVVIGATVDARVRVELIGYVSQPAGVVTDDPDPTADTPAPAPAPAPTPAPAPAPAPASGAAAVAVQYALSKVGSAYVAGASGPTSFDCSGLTMAAWAAAGVKLTHISRVQYDQTQRVALADIQPGDLLFYLGNGVHHVTIYIGNGQMVNAANPASGVVISAVSEPWYAQRLTGVGRVVG